MTNYPIYQTIKSSNEDTNEDVTMVEANDEKKSSKSEEPQYCPMSPVIIPKTSIVNASKSWFPDKKVNDFLENSISEDCEACLRFQEDFFTNKEVKNNPCKNHHPVAENYDKIRRRKDKSLTYTLISAGLFIFIVIGITVSVKVTFSVGEDVYKPSETDKLPKDEKVFLEDTISKDFEIFQVHREIDNDDVEVIDIACCPRIMIISTGLVAELYPGVLGEYFKIELNHYTTSSIRRQVYKKVDRADLYISTPPSSAKVLGYSWGVSNHPDSRWGYIRSSTGGICPFLGGRWRVFDRNINRWRNDDTLHLTCIKEQ